MKRGFTLVELLVVISIVSMLASIVMVQISLAQANGRDSVRTQQIRQIDLATKIFADTYKKTPPLSTTGCDILSQDPESITEAQSSACFAVSTAAADSVQGQNWTTLKSQLQPFINVPNDPCGSSCVSGSSYPIGYTYVAPLAMQYYCVTAGCVVTNDSYQLYAPLERNTVPSGNSGSITNYVAPPSGGGGPAPTINLEWGPVPSPYAPPSTKLVRWSIDDATSCVGNDELGNWNDMDLYVPSDPEEWAVASFYNVTINDETNITCQGPGGQSSKTVLIVP